MSIIEIRISFDPEINKLWKSCMVWQSYENQIIVLDELMVEQISQYLENKESQLSVELLDLILQLEGLPTLVKSVGFSPIKLSEATEEFGRKINQSQQGLKKALKKEKWKFAGKQINQALWGYVEVLEGCVIELFQQIEQIGFEQWTVDLVRAATSIKDELTHRMDDLIWAIRRLEQQLKSYRWICEKGEERGLPFRKIFLHFSSVLDRSLEITVRKCNKFLNFRYRKFVERYTGYLQLSESVHQSMANFSDYCVFSSLEMAQQDKLKQLYFLLKLWEENLKTRVLQRTEPIRALRSCLTFENAVLLFKDYFFSIHQAVFDKSRMIKHLIRRVFNDKQSKQPLASNIANYRMELKVLKDLVNDYKKFHEQTDPGAKRSFKKFFFSQSKPLVKDLQEIQKLSCEIRKLELSTAHFQSSLESSQTPREITPKMQNEVMVYLHEMGQPLVSKNLMRRNAKALLTSLKSLDEIASFDPQVVDFTCLTLCKAMCSDWKYQVLQEIPAFHQIYETHQSIFNLSDDRKHLNRLHKFQGILDQLELWVKNEETLIHAHEINLDIHDIKAYLQDFLAYVQRLEKKEEETGFGGEKFDSLISRAAQALLEYLYLFGRFFSQLLPDNSEHRMLRKQFLFIDQYFEALDRRIQELSQ